MTAARALEVLSSGLLTTVQDAGRTGQAALGVSPSGACDRRAYALANRLVGNPPGTAVLEATAGGLALRASGDVVLVTTGARCTGPWPHLAPTVLPDGAALRLGPPVSGLRTCVAVRGGFDVLPVLGSRSTDLLSGIGPAPLADGDVLAVGRLRAPFPGVDVAPVAEPEGGGVTLAVLPGPRRDWFASAAWSTLVTATYAVSSDSNRIGLRLDGPALQRQRSGELPSEGLVRGAVQVPPSGSPVLFLADHPVTGGYPVIAYVRDDDVDRAAQLRPGQPVRLRAVVPRSGVPPTPPAPLTRPAAPAPLTHPAPPAR